MPNAGWYDDNMGRAYPLVSSFRPSLPDDVIVDFGCLVGPEVGYAATDRVYLHSIRRQDGRVYFEFRSTASGLSGKALLFCRSLDDPRFVIDYSEAGNIPSERDWETMSEIEWELLDETGWETLLGSASNSEESEGSEDSEAVDCAEPELWSGFLVTGDLSRLAAVLEEDDVLLGGSSRQIEPTLVTNLGKSMLHAVHLANKERTRTTAAEGCRPPCYDFDRADVYVHTTCLQGPVRFQPGFNNTIVQNDNDNSLLFSAREEAGAGAPCDEVPLFPGETPPQGSSLLTGGPSCGDTIRSINGLAARLFSLVGGTGVAVTGSTTPHQVTVRITGAVANTDSEESEASEESEEPERLDCDPPSESDDPCECGEELSEESE